MDKNTVIFVSAGLNEPKKAGNPFAIYHSYLNYGFLGLASILSRKGYDVVLLHGKFVNPHEFAERLLQKIQTPSKFPIFLSIPSVFALDWSKVFVKEIKAMHPTVKVIVGGRWVVEQDGSWIRKQLENIDLVVYGTSENRIESLLNINKWPNIPFTDSSNLLYPEQKIEQYPTYNYKLMPDFESFQPSIEVSRGCGLGCSFCMEKDSPLLNLKDPKQIIKEIYHIQNTFKKQNISPYFETSFFRPSTNWSQELLDSFKENNININWRTETRIDSLSENILSNLAETGLKILDVGLETASPLQILRMNKSPKPSAYLEKASRFLKLCKDLDIWVKVNILLYAGESNDTIKETTDWLEEHRSCIKGLSVNQLMIYGHDKNTLNYIKTLEELGAKPVEENVLTKGFARMHLSQTISFEQSEEIRISLSQSFMTNEDYYDLKSFSYFPQSLTKDMFNEICKRSDLSTLPFKMTDVIE